MIFLMTMLLYAFFILNFVLHLGYCVGYSLTSIKGHNDDNDEMYYISEIVFILNIDAMTFYDDFTKLKNANITYIYPCACLLVVQL